MLRDLIPEDLRELLPLTPTVFYVLLSLADGGKHGYAIMQESAILSNRRFRMGPGTLYTALQRLLDLGLIEETEAKSEDNDDKRRRYYQLTTSGRAVLEAEIGRMDSAVRLAKRKKLIPKAAE